MATIDNALISLKEDIINMMHLVNDQIDRSRKCIIELDMNSAMEVRKVEKIVNRIDSSIDNKCESIIALYNPVATDLRFVIAGIQISSSLERIGDLAHNIANYVRKELIINSFDSELLKTVKFNEVYDLVITQVSDSINGFINEDTELSRKVLRSDIAVDAINKETINAIEQFLLNNKKQAKNGLIVFSIMNKLERISALCANIAEDTVYYVEAEILKHKKIKLKKKELKNMVNEAIEGSQENLQKKK